MGYLSNNTPETTPSVWGDTSETSGWISIPDLIEFIITIHQFEGWNPTNTINDILNSLTKLNLTFKDEFKLFVENKPEYIFCEDYCYSHITMDYY